MNQLIKDAEKIKSLEIQGATNVAIRAIDFLSNYAKRLKDDSVEACFESLYKAIAAANGHPDWFAQIKSTFAKRWVSNAQAGWWYQSANGSWKKK